MTQPDQTQPVYPAQAWPTPDTQNEPGTPAERRSIDLYPVVGQGALTIDDGGGSYNYNQDITEDDGRGEWQFPEFKGSDDSQTLLDIFRDILGRLPLPALQIIETFLSGGIEVFENVTDAIEKIMNSLSFDNIALRWDSFLDMLTGFAEATTTDLDNWLLSLVGIDTVSAGSLSKESPELLKNPFFATPISVQNGSTPGWVLDGADTHSVTGNSAVLTTTAVVDYTLISSVVAVEAEKIIELRAYVKWSNITSAAGADAISLCLLPDQATSPTDGIVVDTIPLSVATTDETTDWIELDGRYTMPDETTFPKARLMVRLEGLNVGAQVRVSDVSFKKALPAQWWPMEWIDGLFDAFSAVDEFFQNIIGAILGGFVDDDSSHWSLGDLLAEIGSWFDSTEDTAAGLSNAESDILVAQTGIAELGSASVSIVANRATRNQAWVCRYPVADVSYPEALNMSLGIFGDSGPADPDTGGAHTHDDGTYSASAGGNAVIQEASRGAYITCSNTFIMTHVGMGVWVAAGTAPDDVNIDVFREADDGSLEQLGTMEISGDLTETAQMIIEELPDPIICQAGERYVVRLRNESTNATYVYQQNVLRTDTMDDTGFYTTGDALTAQTSYTSGEATTAQGNTSRLPFAMLAAPAATGTDTAYLDDFNDRAELGPMWLTASDGTTDRLTITSDTVAYNGADNNAHQLALYISPTSSDRMLTIADFSNVYLNIVGAEISLFICADRELTQVVALVVEQTLGVSSVKIMSGDPFSMTTRATVSGLLFPDNNYTLTYNPVTNIFEGLKDGAAIGAGLSWEDTGDVINHGKNYRYGGMMIERTGLANAGRIDDWFLRDYAT